MLPKEIRSSHSILTGFARNDNKILRKLYLTLFIALISIVSYAQQDSTLAEEDSVVYIYEDPVVVRRAITQEENIYKHWFLELYGASFLYKNRHCLCEDLANYKAELRKVAKPLPGFGFGIGLRYNPSGKKITFSAGLASSSFRESFKHSDSLSGNINRKNIYQYLDLSTGVGYWLFRKSKISLIPNVDLLLSRLLSNKDNKELDYSNPTLVLNSSDAHRDARWILGGQAALKFLFFNNRSIKLMLEPYMRMNFTSTLEYKDNYFLQRWTYGARLGLLYVL
ncbi:MAG TPA: hypothetical protein VNB90_07705 [Cytophagaceae bacterium]|nr:hypothetical protein [Cytophagaceae bacterium]